MRNKHQWSWAQNDLDRGGLETLSSKLRTVAAATAGGKQILIKKPNELKAMMGQELLCVQLQEFITIVVHVKALETKCVKVQDKHRIEHSTAS